MQKLFDNYLKYLSDNPGHIESIIMWHISTFVVWAVMMKYRERMIAGSSGEDTLWQSPEFYGYIILWMCIPIVNYSAFFNVELSIYVWCFIGGIAVYTIGGRWLFEWFLAFRAGKTTVEETTVTTAKASVTTETKTTE